MMVVPIAHGFGSRLRLVREAPIRVYFVLARVRGITRRKRSLLPMTQTVYTRFF